MMRFIMMWVSIAKAEIVAREKQRRLDLHNKHLELYEAKIAQANNAVLLQDLEIEKRKLELEAMEKELHPLIHDPDSESPPFP